MARTIKQDKTRERGHSLIGEGIPLSDFERESLKWRGVVLAGKYRHWCAEWDDLPTDETCPEFEVCSCFEKGERERLLRDVLEAAWLTQDCYGIVALKRCVTRLGEALAAYDKRGSRDE